MIDLEWVPVVGYDGWLYKIGMNTQYTYFKRVGQPDYTMIRDEEFFKLVGKKPISSPTTPGKKSKITNIGKNIKRRKTWMDVAEEKRLKRIEEIRKKHAVKTGFILYYN